MPFASVKVIKGVFSAAEKQRLIENVSEAIIEVEGEALRDKTIVVLEETLSGDWGVGGSTLTSDMVRGLRASA